MVDVEPCELHEVSGCTRCSGRDACEERETDQTMTGLSFLAQYNGHCPDCNLPIWAGQRIRYSYLVYGYSPIHDWCS